MRKLLILFFILFLFVQIVININDNIDRKVDIKIKREPIIVEKLPLADDNWEKHFKSEPTKGEWQKYLIDL